MKPVLLLCIAILVSTSTFAQEASILNPSGLPIPRYVSLKSGEVNVRVGPGKRYPIQWVYQRPLLPVQIIEEFAHWRKIRDMEGTTGWVHKGLLAGTRTAIMIDKPQNLYSKPKATSRILAKAEPGVIGVLTTCTPDWCELTVGGYNGWMRKSNLWGVSREEVFED